jgi:hypothetical protein
MPLSLALSISEEPGSSVSMVARRYDVNANQVFAWRKRYRAEATAPAALQLMPVRGHAGSGDRARGGERADRDRAGRRLPCSGRQWGQGPGVATGAGRAGAAMIPVLSGVRVWLAVGRTDMRLGMNGLALQVQQTLGVQSRIVMVHHL